MDAATIEVWQMTASGLVGSLITALNAITPRDTRGVLERDNSLNGWLRMEAAQTLQYAPSDEAVRRCIGYIEDIRYAPRLSDLYMRPSGAAVQGSTLVADAPVEPWQLIVYQWDFVRFNRLGLLADNNQPGVGTYVIVPEKQTGQGLPSAFLTIA